MALKTPPLTEELHAYVVANGSEPDEVARDLLAETGAALPDLVQLSVAPEQAAFLTLLTRVMGVRLAVEVGTFTGFSALAIARGLVDGGRLICFDVSDEYTRIARRYWARAGVEDRVELRLGRAGERLAELPPDARLDLVFIDADKESYPAYWDALVPRVRPGGVLLADNVLSHGRVLNPDESLNAQHIVAFNEMVRTDPRVDAMLLPIGDGLTFAVKR